VAASRFPWGNGSFGELELQRERDTKGALWCGALFEHAQATFGMCTRLPRLVKGSRFLRHNTTDLLDYRQRHPPARSMCGIFFALSRHGHIAPDESTHALLRNRGPDHTGLHQPVLSREDGTELHATFLSTVLSLRGTEIVSQPLINASTGSVLCWNGEAWSISGDAVAGNDSKLVFDRLLKACADTTGSSKSAVVELLSHIRGPYAIVFYDATNNHIYYGRDCLGRRSLLQKSTPDGALVLSSVCDNATGEAWAEVEANGIYFVDLNDFTDPSSITHIPHASLRAPSAAELLFVGRYCSSKYLLISSDPTISTNES
jgi:hypothetical protein